MPYILSFQSIPGLVLMSAMGYALSAVGMKTLSLGHIPSGICVLTIGLAIAVMSEILLLRMTSLSVVYMTIIAVETILVMGYAVSIGEMLTFRQGVGAGLVFAGLLAISV
jgi:hypothetical protein